MIGLAGALLGVLVGWAASRAFAFAAISYLESQKLPPVDPFTMPGWAPVVAVFFGVGVATLAGVYLASRAARVDPVQALRGE